MDILAGGSWTRLLDMPTLWAIVVLVVAMTAILAPHWRRLRQTGEVTRLIHRMMEKGYSAEEIERILRAGLPEDADGRRDQRKSFLRPHDPRQARREQ